MFRQLLKINIKLFMAISTVSLGLTLNNLEMSDSKSQKERGLCIRCWRKLIGNHI